VPPKPGEGPAPANPGGDEPHLEATILARLPLGVFVLDTQGRLTYLNASAERFFARVANRERDQLLGQPIWETCPEVADSAFAREYKCAAAEQRDFELEVYYPSLGRWFALRACLAGDSRPFFVEDITPRVELERAARRHAAEMAELEGGQDEFLLALAHKLRNTLVPIRNALHLIASREEQAPEVEQVCALGEKEVQQLSRLVDDLLQVAHANAGRLRPHPERLDLAKVVAQALDAILAAGEGRGRSVTVNLPPEPLEVVADPQLLHDVFTHLITNAIRFSLPRGQIWLTAERRADAVEVSVRDDGVGIAPEILPRVFDLFMRMGPPGDRPHREGLGIGLTVVRHLVELQGGEVESYSDGIGKGAEFLVRLPVATAPPSEPQTAVAGVVGPHHAPMRILVADNDPTTAQSVTALLQLWGYEVRTSYAGGDALQEALVWRPEVVVLDIGMPDMDGYEVAALLRAEPSLKGLVLVALTGYAQEKDRERAEDVGFDHYLVKPVPPETLRELLSDLESAFREGLSQPSR
jgi:signal transduction histidine kinase/ActR/RegA family two-component response regulator